MHVYVHMNIYSEVSWNGGYPQIIHFNGIFMYFPSSYGGIPIYGNPHNMYLYIDTLVDPSWWGWKSIPAAATYQKKLFDMSTLL